jgi:hypothetical protein
MRVGKNLYFVKTEYLIDIGKKKKFDIVIVECILIVNQKVVLFPKFRKNQKEAIVNALMGL